MTRMLRPVFDDPSDDSDEFEPEGFMIGGMAHYRDVADLARAYREAGDRLIDSRSGEPWRVGYPALFLYRHSLELYFKAVVGPQHTGHSLKRLLGAFISVVTTELHEHVPNSFRVDVRAFAEMDPDSQAFRYTVANASPIAGREAWVDPIHVRAAMDRLTSGFESILTALARRRMGAA